MKYPSYLDEADLFHINNILASPVPVPVHDPPTLDCGQYTSGETCMSTSNIKSQCCWCNASATCIHMAFTRPLYDLCEYDKKLLLAFQKKRSF